MIPLIRSIRNLGRDNRDPCPIWPRHKATVRKEGTLYIVEDSDRVGTSYSFNRPTQLALESKLRDDRDRAKLTTILLDLNRQGVEIPEITSELISRALAAPMLSVAERADRMLMFIGSKCDRIDETFSLGRRHHRNGALAWTESVTHSEGEYIWEYILDEKEWITLLEHDTDFEFVDYLVCIITPAGHARIAELSAHTDSAQAFVAMWFHESQQPIYDDAISPAIKEAGYDPYRIDREHFSDTITDKIIAEIRRSRFLVADFTHGCEGARGSVYYEAGFAHGLNIPVIFTAKEGVKPHFDTATYPHILWHPDKLPTFQSALKDRILALKELGPGPRNP